MAHESSAHDSPPAPAGVDSIVYEFERALLRGDFAPLPENTLDFDEWLVRVEPGTRPLLGRLLNRRFEHWQRCVAETKDLESTDLALEAPLSEGDFSELPFPEPQAEWTWGHVLQCPSLRRLPPESKAALAERIRLQEFRAGTRLLTQGQTAAGLFLIVSGNVEIIDSSGDTATCIDVDGPGSVVGEMSLLTGQPCTADVAATSDVAALVLGVDDFHDLCRRFPELELALSQLVSDRLGQRPHDALCGKVIEGFRFVRCISRGAMGVVYEAVPPEASAPQPVALKMLRHRFLTDERAHRRFDQEAAMLRSLQHPRIVRLLGHFVAYRTRFLILELCEGADLKQTLHVRGRFDEATVRAIIGQIAGGLAHAHRLGVLHLDLKPANVLLHRNGCVALTDFGLGRLMESDGCDSCIAGTPPYMPPEQFKDEAVGPACDAYALGCVAYELLTGEMLFPRVDLFRLFELKQQPSDERINALEISDSFKQVLSDLLQPRWEQRRFDLDQLASWEQPAKGLV